ncbi:hypothetical protein N7445_003233 [Penicillium cf. griseofulvum]|nr:hypothetical protein N7445_003233 [Penicillium cf. griseofulvum]
METVSAACPGDVVAAGLGQRRVEQSSWWRYCGSAEDPSHEGWLMALAPGSTKMVVKQLGFCVWRAIGPIGYRRLCPL